MAALLALINRSAFEVLEKQYGTLVPGTVLPIDRYSSANPALKSLAGEGILHLVAVRPPDERLWLMAVLRHPRFEEGAWVSEPNQVPVCDITSLIPELKTASGKGLTAAPGKLAMSLQTPRQLADSDVVLLKGLEAPSPGSAYHAAMVAALGGTGAKGRIRPRPMPEASPLREEPLDWQEALADIGTWRTLGERARQAAVEAVVEQLAQTGEAFSVGSTRCGVDRLGTVVHVTSSTELVVVPGGEYAMGYTADDVLAVWRACPVGGEDDTDKDEVLQCVAPSRPPRWVKVKPFLAGRNLVSEPSLRAAAGLAENASRDDVLGALGWRLPASEEWEWIGREGGAVRFVGVPRERHPLKPSLVPPAEEENGWGFRGLLNDENACQGKEMRMGHTWWQSEVEVLGLHAACRLTGAGGAIRLCRDIPGAPEPKQQYAGWDQVCLELRAALRVTGKERERALRSLACLGEGPDTQAVLSGLLPDLETMDVKVLAVVAAMLHQAGEAGRCGAVRLLSHADVRVRTAAAHALGQPVQTDQEREALLEALRRESKPTAIASLVLALGPHLEVGERIRHKDPLVRAAAAIALLKGGGASRLEGEVLVALAEATGLPPRPEVVWWDGDMASQALTLVEGAPAGVQALAACALAARGDRSSLASALRLVFGEPGETKYPPIREAKALTPGQREVALVLAGLPKISISLEGYGLPEYLEDLRIWLGLDAPGIMETLIEVKGRQVPFWRFFSDLRQKARNSGWSAETWVKATRPVLEGLSPRLRLGLRLECGRYFLWLQTENRWGLELPEPIPTMVEQVGTEVARELALDRLSRPRAGEPSRLAALEALVCALAPGETLPEALWPSVRPGWPCSRALVEAIPVSRREGALLPMLLEKLQAAREQKGWYVWGGQTVDAWVPLLEVIPSVRVALILLQLGAAQGMTAENRGKLAPYATLPWVSAALKMFDDFGEVKDVASMHRLLMLEISG